MEEVLLCCGSLFFIGAILLGVFSFSLFSRQTRLAPADTFLPNSKDRIDSHRSRMEFLLALIGIWLGLPSLCGIFQGIVENIMSLISIDNSLGITIKLINDMCLFGGLLFGFVLLALFTLTTWSASAIGLLLSSQWEKFKSWVSTFRKKNSGDATPIEKEIKEEGKEKREKQDQTALQEMSKEISKIVFEIVTERLVDFEINRRKNEETIEDTTAEVSLQIEKTVEEIKPELALQNVSNIEEIVATDVAKEVALIDDGTQSERLDEKGSEVQDTDQALPADNATTKDNPAINEHEST